ncbi:MAG: dihydrodipicolinate synthase family protein [Candidatus Thermoplasmatota archaeon]|nr:dihydrodipicolinate synthase family protein [Candidatus Thermoplasmatota archaeon]MCL5794614.1 dihydrodipicolinate synthase family protein [Candidatus Thermoplasmatota archaeon]
MTSLLITPMITPFDSRGNIDYDAAGLLIRRLESSRVDALFPLGSTGLFPWLSVEERKKFTEFVVQHTRLPVYVGVGSPNAEEAILLSRHAEDCGAYCGVIMPPYYIRPGRTEMRDFFRSVFSSTEFRFYLYNIPQLAGTQIPIDLALELKDEFDGVLGMKESSADMRYFSDLNASRTKKFKLLQGQDDMLLASLAMGADGGVCGTTNLTSDAQNLRDLFDRGNFLESSAIHNKKVVPLMHALNLSTFPSGYYYGTYRATGISGGYRTPMSEPDQSVMLAIDGFITPSS